MLTIGKQMCNLAIPGKSLHREDDVRSGGIEKLRCSHSSKDLDENILTRGNPNSVTL